MNPTTFFEYDAVVIGSGAAGYSAACRLREDGRKTVCIVTESVLCGTSRNTGSDKQTYYKLGLGGSLPDSVRDMASDLFKGGCVDGDNALCEAAFSTRCFHYLCEAGVPFPHTSYGEYIGYKTDHDPRARATSAGPLTSKFMTEALERKANNLDIPVYDSLLAVELLKNEGGICGLLCLHVQTQAFYVFQSPNVILATGGPAGIYEKTVYPEGHTGSTGLALAAGASLQNMTEWQYGLASVAPRWNVSGTYMQVLPRLISVDENGNESEFLSEEFDDPYEALSLLFLKGYQWPFDAKKAKAGSSRIDLLVHREQTIRGRRVFLDFTKNPLGLNAIDFEKLSTEAYTYLKNAGACFGPPIDRLRKMNSPAVSLYTEKGVDLSKHPLEIALCAQHNNGGIAVDADWQTDVKGLYAVGECAGTHGVTRPGGSALNAGQVGALRAAQAISQSTRNPMNKEQFQLLAKAAIGKNQEFCLSGSSYVEQAESILCHTRRSMSDAAAAIRNAEKMQTLYSAVKKKLSNLPDEFHATDPPLARYRLRDTLTVQLATLGAMLDYRKTVSLSRGSALYADENGCVAFSSSDMVPGSDRIQAVRLENVTLEITWRPVRPIPEESVSFESMWREYRENNQK